MHENVVHITSQATSTHPSRYDLIPYLSLCLDRGNLCIRKRDSNSNIDYVYKKTVIEKR